VRLATSRYNFCLPLSDGHALYNASTGGVMKLEGRDSAELAELLAGPRTAIEEDELGEELAGRLWRNGFVVDAAADEVEPVRERYWTARGRAPVVLVVTTTMECNLGCYYCYESRSGDAIGADSADELARVAAERLERQGKRSLHVNWYGGEPLLNIDAMERGSLAMQRYCKEAGVAYHASVLSNGTRWPEDVGAFVERHKLRQIQISFDGLQTAARRSSWRRAWSTGCCSTRVSTSASTPTRGTRATCPASSRWRASAAGSTRRTAACWGWRSSPCTRSARRS
jgi:uncharacterized protein